MSFFQYAPKPKTPLGWHRILSPNAAVKVSPICMGGIGLGTSWSSIFGQSEDAFALLDTYYALGGNFVDTSNVYNSEDSERLIGEWMEARGVRDQMVVATKYTAGFRAYNREQEPLQSNFVGNSVKSMHISVRESLKKLRTDYIDILYVHWWDFATSVEEVMRGLHAHVMAKEVLYLGISNAPAWIVVKANACKPPQKPASSFLGASYVTLTWTRRPRQRPHALLYLPGQMERRLPRHGGRDRPDV